MFTHLDPSDPQREFQLGVHVVTDNRYTGVLVIHAVCTHPMCTQLSGVCQNSSCLAIWVYRTDSAECRGRWPSACVCNGNICLCVQ